MPTLRPVHLSPIDHERLSVFLHRGKANVRTLKRAQILLKLGAGWSTTQVAEAYGVCPNTVTNLRTRYLTGGLDAVLHDRKQWRRRAAPCGADRRPASPSHRHCLQPRARRPRPLDAADAGGQSRRAWVCRAHRHPNHPQPLEKTALKPWQHAHWCLPSVGAEFVAAMEAVLDLYEEEYDPRYPTVCLDEKPVVLHEQTRPVLPPSPGRPARRDYEDVREDVRRGTANLFVVVEPLSGWRQVTPTAQRTQVDYAQQLRRLSDAIYPEAEYMRLVQDHLNTHTLASLYEVFSPSEARRIASRFEVHYTPKHGSWLNMAEIEISVFERGCLSRPVGNFETLDRRVKALEAERNAARCTIQWQFTSQQARTKLVDLYPLKQT